MPFLETGAGGLGPGAGGEFRSAGPVTHFRDLIVWQRGMDVAMAVYRASSSFPKSELYGLTSQVRRAAVSVPSNIAEGHSRESTKEYLKHISIPQASLAEVETQLELAVRLKYLEGEVVHDVLQQCGVLGKQLYRLRDALLSRS
jgi:four helix bundle protein